MSYLSYRHNKLYLEDCSLEELIQTFNTPLYVYSKASLIKNWKLFDNAFDRIPHRICYAVKANSNLAILNVFAKLNSSFDIVSLGELERVIAAGGKTNRIIFSGVGKTHEEIERAIEIGIYCFNIESFEELARIQEIAAKKNKIVNIALRINPDIDAKTHSHIATGLKENKFGIDYEDVLSFCQDLKNSNSINLIGLACHIGSQLTTLTPFLEALDRLLLIFEQLKQNHFSIQHINIGGGLGIVYQHEKPPAITEYANALQDKLISYPLTLLIEPGRAIVGDAGVLLTRVEYLKHSNHKNFAIVDAGMNDLLRPALYNAWQNILPVNFKDRGKKIYEIVGPVCESADFLGHNRELALLAGDCLAIDTVGAYGFSMSSNYNSRNRAAEVLVDGRSANLIRRRETIKDLISLEENLSHQFCSEIKEGI